MTGEGRVERSLKLAIVTNGDANDAKVWSGTPFQCTQALRTRFAGAHLIEDAFVDKVLSTVNRAARRLGIDLFREPVITKLIGYRTRRKIDKFKPDVIVSIGASHKLAYCDISAPIVHVSDALFDSIVSTYERYKKLSDRSRSLGRDLQIRVIERCKHLVLSSNWAREDSIKHYSIAENFISVLPFGANVRVPPIEDLIFKDRKLELIYIGKDWAVKGGDKVIEVFKALRARAPDAKLHLIGHIPGQLRSGDGIEVHGFLDPRDEAQARRQTELLAQSAFLTVLSFHEAFGLVFCEAAAFGLPAISHNVGGISTIVRNDETGLLFDTQADAKTIADRMFELWQDRERYEAMSRAARDRFDQTLNWDSWSKSIANIIESVQTCS